MYATSMQGEDFYTVEEAARALRLTPDRIHQMLRDGELEGVPPREGGPPGWKVPVRVIHGRGYPPPIDLSEGSTTVPERPSELGDISGPEDEDPEATPAQPQRGDDAAQNNREPITPPTHRETAQEVARILQTNVDALLLEAKDEAIADLRDRVAFLERQLEGRVEEIRRRDHIIAALTERIPPAIEVPDDRKPSRVPESTAEEPAREAPASAGSPKSGSETPRDTAEFPGRGSLLRPWWKRVFRR